MRITVPPGHTALILSSAHAEDLMKLLKAVRTDPRDINRIEQHPAYAHVAGETMLALLEARTA